MITFTDIHWRNSDDSDVFNLHAVNSIELNPTKNVVTINCAAGKYQAPYYGFTYGGGVVHAEFTTKHPYEDRYISIAIFEFNGAVCVASHSDNVPAWFKNKCKNFVC